MNYSISRSNKRIIYWILCFHCLAIYVPHLHAENIKPGKKYDYNWASLKSHPIPKWFDDAKFGIFIHWGPYSVMGYRKGGRGYSEHTPKEIYRNPEHYYEYLKETFGAHPPEFGYKDIIPLFKAESWNPDKWAELFQKAGARYVVLTAEHHDGYAMWDSDLTQWCAMKVGPKRDLVGELGKAVRRRGMKYAPSYHRERHTGFFALEKYAIKSQPHPDIIKEIAQMPIAVELYGPFEYSDAFIRDYVARWKEIEKKYRPDFMWIDDVPIFYKVKPHPQTKKFRNAFMYMIADYFNAAEQWGKEVYLNNKGANLNWPEGPGCLEKDNLKLETIGPKWENPATLGTSYGYMKAEEERDAYKNPTELIHLLCDIVSKNGNLLLNIGPRADGTIPEGMKQRLLAIGKWLQINGEAIYGTRPWVTFKQDTPDLRFTTKGNLFNILYAIALTKPTKPFVIQKTKDWKTGSVTSVKLLGSDTSIEWKETKNGIHITPPQAMPGKHAWTFKIENIKASLLTQLFKPQQHLTFDEKLKSSDNSVWFALYHDYGGFGDPSWHVFKIPINEIPETLKIPTNYKSKKSEKYDFWKNRMLMWNWSEAGNHTSNPHIKIFNKRHLVFIRGGYYHGLYDIVNNKTLMTDTSPWHSLAYSEYENSRDLNLNEINSQMDKWVEDTLHNPIKKIIETGQIPKQTTQENIN